MELFPAAHAVRAVIDSEELARNACRFEPRLKIQRLGIGDASIARPVQQQKGRQAGLDIGEGRGRADKAGGFGGVVGEPGQRRQGRPKRGTGRKTATCLKLRITNKIGK